ncbi:vWA domain-containing protein [Xanthovirga aplysinae]|uniref:vWA domain-containing protein n=1 Tax=Xanthovirga aplysinae TaxID=2529853 RepID=UPI0012BB560F|nr:VWA domain-containing protein [Xanthovirga aplysinae]MTI31140.1 VWA domain-containing protein [Xanthovirga aplysinae]
MKNSFPLPSGNFESKKEIDLIATIRQHLLLEEKKLMYKTKASQSYPLIMFMVDASASMAKMETISYIKGCLQASVKKLNGKVKFGVVWLAENKVEIIPETRNTKQLIDQMKEFPVGGKTDLLQLFQRGEALLRNQTLNDANAISLFLFTDGRINAGLTQNPREAAISFFNKNFRKYRQKKLLDFSRGNQYWSRDFAEKTGMKFEEAQRPVSGSIS